MSATVLLKELIERLDSQGIPAHVAHTGGGVATLYVGVPQLSLDHDGQAFQLYPAMGGPATFDWGSGAHYLTLGDFSVGPGTDIFGLRDRRELDESLTYTTTEQDTPDAIVSVIAKLHARYRAPSLRSLAIAVTAAHLSGADVRGAWITLFEDCLGTPTAAREDFEALAKATRLVLSSGGEDGARALATLYSHPYPLTWEELACTPAESSLIDHLVRQHGWEVFEGVFTPAQALELHDAHHKDPAAYGAGDLGHSHDGAPVAPAPVIEAAAHARILAAVAQANTRHGLWVGALPTADAALVRQLIEQGALVELARTALDASGTVRTLHYLALP